MTERLMEAFEEAWSIEEEVAPLHADDEFGGPPLAAHLPHLIDTVTRIGGEVCRLRAEVDGLLDQNAELLLRFKRIAAVIEEKGMLNMDDFELACDVLGADDSAPLAFQNVRRARH
jgi:hypothetical protein